MEKAILVVHVLTAISLVGLILLQHGKGADAGAAFGGGGSQSLLGGDGSTSLFTKITVMLAVVFFVTSLSLAYINKHEGDSNSIVIPEATTVPGSVAEPESDIPQVTVNPIESDDDVPVVETAPDVSDDIPQVTDTDQETVQ